MRSRRICRRLRRDSRSTSPSSTPRTRRTASASPRSLRRALRGRRRRPDHRQPCLGPARDRSPTIDRDPRLLRPANFPPGTPGAGTLPAHARRRARGARGQPDGPAVHGRARRPVPRGSTRSSPRHALGRDVAAIVVDFHAEATSEKTAFGHFADGRVSAVLGTHTHVPTADAQILPGGTAYHERCRDVRRLRFGDRHAEGGRRCAAS